MVGQQMENLIMTQYSDEVEYQKTLLLAEKWAKGVKFVHIHSLSTMWYDDRPQDTKSGPVVDKGFYNGIIKRYKNNKLIHTFGKALKGKDLVSEFNKFN